MTLKELIATEPANATRTEQEVLAWLLEDTAEFQPFNSTLVGLSEYIPDPSLITVVIDRLISLSATNSLANEALIMMRNGIPINWANNHAIELIDATLTSGEAIAFKSIFTKKNRHEAVGLPKPRLHHIREAK